MTPGTPRVSVIVPVRDDARGIADCLDALLRQTYPADLYEIIVADNGSSDDTRAVVMRRAARTGGRLRLVVEDEVRSSYAARNRALREVRGEMVAFTDADCTPAPTWLAQGVNVLETQGGGSVAGHVMLTYRRAQPNAYEYWDSAVHLNQADLVRRYGFGATANLFTYRRLFDRYGLFRADLFSGGDKEFGHRLRLGGEALAYAVAAVVQHPARATLRAAWAKSLRLARAHRNLHASGVIASRWRCARGLRPIRHCPRPPDWHGRLPWSARLQVLALRNLDAWLTVTVCLGQGALELVRGGITARRGRWG